jgi:hypothetical protein
VIDRIRTSLSGLDREQQLAGLAALALMVTLFLPWYQVSVAEKGDFVQDSRNAFGVFTFVEAAVLLVAAGVLTLLFTRGERKAFHLPGGDGTVILAAGAWAALLLLWRVFDRPDVAGRGVTVGITWGFFFAFIAAAALAGAGWRMRQAHAPEPPNPMADDPETPEDESLSEQMTLLADPDEAPTQRAPRPRREPRARRGDLH